LDHNDFEERVERIVGNVELAVSGKRDSVFLAVVAMLAGGHVLIEDVPGVGKTLLAKSLARSLRAEFRRIQFTPDLLPADVTGLNVYNQGEGDFEFWAGPVFANVVLADEINRASPKTQSARVAEASGTHHPDDQGHERQGQKRVGELMELGSADQTRHDQRDDPSKKRLPAAGRRPDGEPRGAPPRQVPLHRLGHWDGAQDILHDLTGGVIRAILGAGGRGDDPVREHA
jgi:hypothetical protein